MSAERGPSGGGRGAATITRGNGGGERLAIRSTIKAPKTETRFFPSPRPSPSRERGHSFKNITEFRASTPQQTDRKVSAFNSRRTAEWRPVIASSVLQNEAIPSTRLPRRSAPRNDPRTISQKDFNARFAPFELPKADTQRNVQQKGDLQTRPFNLDKDGAQAVRTGRLEKAYTIRTKFIEKPKSQQTITKSPELQNPRESRVMPREKDIYIKPSNKRERFGNIEVRPSEQHPIQFKQKQETKDTTKTLEQRKDNEQAQKVAEAYVRAGIFNREEARKKVEHILQEKKELVNPEQNKKLELPLPAVIKPLPIKQIAFENHVQELVHQRGLEYAHTILKYQGKEIPIEKVFHIGVKQYLKPAENQAQTNHVAIPEASSNTDEKSSEQALLLAKKQQPMQVSQKVKSKVEELIEVKNYRKEKKEEQASEGPECYNHHYVLEDRNGGIGTCPVSGAFFTYDKQAREKARQEGRPVRQYDWDVRVPEWLKSINEANRHQKTKITPRSLIFSK